MTGGFTLRPEREGRRLLLAGPDGPVAALDFGVPGPVIPGFEPDADEILHTRTPDLDARVRVFNDLGAWSIFVSVDNLLDQPREQPPLGVAVTVFEGWAGWSWTSDTQGFIALAPGVGSGTALVLRLRQGFLRAAQSRPAFTDEVRQTRAAGPAPLPPGCAAFHLALPGSALGAHRRQQVVLQLDVVEGLDAVGALLPGWLPRLVEPEGTEIQFVTPDRAVVPGQGVEEATVGASAVVLGHAGHREVALHDVRGVQRLRVTWVPELSNFLAELAAALTSRRPSAVSTASAVVVAEALARGVVVDEDPIVDWLEREDWLARGDLLGIAVAVFLAAHTGDAALAADARTALACREVEPGYGFVAMRLWLAELGLTGTTSAPAAELLGREAADDLARLELAVLTFPGPVALGPVMEGLANRLGATLPGEPVGMPASTAGRLVGLLRLCPERADQSARAFATAEKAAGLLLADYADGLHAEWDGLAWLLLGELGI